MNATDAVVRDRGYSGYDGPRVIGNARRVLAEATVRFLLNSKNGRRWLTVGFLTAIVTAIIIWGERKMASGNVGADYALRLLTKPYGVILPGLFIAMAAAAGTIAEDRRSGAFPFYFARPVLPRDYLLGRWLGTFVSLVAVVTAPTTLLALYRATIMGELDEVLAALGVAAIVAVLGTAVAAITATYALLAGAVAGSRGTAQGLTGAVFVLPWIIAGVGANVLDGPWASLFSLPHLVESIGAPLISMVSGKQRGLADLFQMGVEGLGDHDPHLSLPVAVVALAVIGVGWFLLLRERVERLGRAGGQSNDS